MTATKAWLEEAAVAKKHMQIVLTFVLCQSLSKFVLRSYL